MEANGLRDICIEVIRNLPPTCTQEEIMYELNLTSQVLEGLKHKQEGKAISTEELLKSINDWRRSEQE